MDEEVQAPRESNYISGVDENEAAESCKACAGRVEKSMPIRLIDIFKIRTRGCGLVFQLTPFRGRCHPPVMPTLTQNLDDLDRLVDSGCAAKHEIRGQIALISGEVTALEADYARLAEAHALFQDETAKRIDELETQNRELVAKITRLEDYDAHFKPKPGDEGMFDGIAHGE